MSGLHPSETPARSRAAELARMEIGPRAARNDDDGTLDRRAFERAAELRLLGLTLPEDAGGAGGDATAAVSVHHELARSDPGFALAYLAHAILFTYNFYHSANAEQRSRVLPHALSGEAIGAMGMTEPSGGTDVLAMKTTAERRGEHYVLRGRKTLITNAPDASYFLIYAKVDGDLTAFLVERSCPGFSVGRPIAKMGMRSAPMAELVFDECAVPKRNLLGRERAAIVQMMRNLEMERLCLAAIALGIADRCLEVMLSAITNRAASSILADDGHVQRLVSEAFASTRAAESLVYAMAKQFGTGSRAGADAAKLFAAPVAKHVADSAMEVQAIAGIGDDGTVARFFRDAKLLEIGGGTLEAHQRNIVRELTKRTRAGKW